MKRPSSSTNISFLLILNACRTLFSATSNKLSDCISFNSIILKVTSNEFFLAETKWFISLYLLILLLAKSISFFNVLFNLILLDYLSFQYSKFSTNVGLAGRDHLGKLGFIIRCRTFVYKIWS